MYEICISHRRVAVSASAVLNWVKYENSFSFWWFPNAVKSFNTICDRIFSYFDFMVKIDNTPLSLVRIWYFVCLPRKSTLRRIWKYNKWLLNFKQHCLIDDINNKTEKKLEALSCVSYNCRTIWNISWSNQRAPWALLHHIDGILSP